jgi:LacI family transcriptional regulator
MMVPEAETDRLQRELVDGVIAVAWEPRAVELLEDLENTPVVFINRLDLSDRFHNVGTDHEDAGFKVARHLIERGHRRPAMAVHRVGWASQAQARGFLRAVKDAGLDVDERLICHIEPETFPFNEVSRLLKLEADGIWVPGEDMQALRALHALQHVLGRRVPEDVSIVGTENPGISSHALPPLTALAHPHRELAERAVELLLDLAGNPDAKRNNILLPTSVIERESVLHRNRNPCVAVTSPLHA